MGKCGMEWEWENRSSFTCLAATAWPDIGFLPGCPEPGPQHPPRQTDKYTHTCMTTIHIRTHPTSHLDLVLRTQACVNSVRRSAQQESGGILEAGPLGVLLCLPPLHSDHNIRKSGKKLKQRSIRSPGILSSVPIWSCWPSGCAPRSIPPLWVLGSVATVRRPWWPERPHSAAGSWVTRRWCSQVSGASAWWKHQRPCCLLRSQSSRVCPGPSCCRSSQGWHCTSAHQPGCPPVLPGACCALVGPLPL